MNDSINISENMADTLYDAATAQYAYQTLELLRHEYDLVSPDEQEAINDLIEQGAQIMLDRDFPEAYVQLDECELFDIDERGLNDWAYAIQGIFIEDDHVSSRAFARSHHFENPTAYVTLYPLNPTDEQLAEARDMHILFGDVDKSAAVNIQQLAAITEAAIKGVDLVTVDNEQDINNLRATYKSDGTTSGE